MGGKKRILSESFLNEEALWEGLIMKVWATIVVLISSVIGFVFSYDIAYKKIIQLIHHSDELSQNQGK